MLQVGATGIEEEEKYIKWRMCPSQKFARLLCGIIDDKLQYVKGERP
jgi:hypothetical protein